MKNSESEYKNTRMIQIGRPDGYLVIFPTFRPPEDNGKDMLNKGYSEQSGFRFNRTKKDIGAVISYLRPNELAGIADITDMCKKLHNQKIYDLNNDKKEENKSNPTESKNKAAFLPLGDIAKESQKMMKYSPAECYVIWGDKVDGWLTKVAEKNPVHAERIALAKQLYKDEEIFKCEEFYNLPAYTTVLITSGKKTIYEIYEQSESAQKCIESLKWNRSKLMENVEKYPQNQKAIDAIDIAIDLIRAGAFHERVEEKQSEGNDSAYTVKLSGASDIKGKTPAEILLSDENGKTRLESQKKFLSQHLSGPYAKANKKQIDAINNALKLLEEGKLSTAAAAETGTKIITLYESVLLPNQYKKYEKDPSKIFWHSIKISWYIGEPSPVSIEIQNMYAGLDISNGMKPMGDRIEDKKASFSLTKSEWLYILDEMMGYTKDFQQYCRENFFNKKFK